MNTRLLIILGIVVAAGTTVALGANLMMEHANQREMELNQRNLASDAISDPICFIVDKNSDESASGVTLDRCFTQNEFEDMGCTKPMLEHLYQYSNLLDYDPSGEHVLATIGLPDGMSSEKFQECVDAILEKRPIMNSEQDKSKTCPDGQDYNKVLFKCVVSCKNGLVYNGYTDSCTTEFELQYHGFCNEGFVYDVSSHMCYSGDSQQIPLKDPPRTPPPEPPLEKRVPSNLEYDPLCSTSFWMHVSDAPSESHVSKVILDALKEQGLDFTADDISFYKNDSLFVANIIGDWDEQSSVGLSLTSILESLDGVVAVGETRIACA